MVILKTQKNLKIMYKKIFHGIVPGILQQKFFKLCTTIKVTYFISDNVNADGNYMYAYNKIDHNL